MSVQTDVSTYDELDQYEQQGIRRQVDSLVRQQDDAAYSDTVTTALRARRVWRGDHPIDIVVESTGDAVLALQGQVLVARDDLDAPGVSDLLTQLGLSVEIAGDSPVDALVAVLNGHGDMAVAADALRAAGVQATLHHMVPAGARPVLKPTGVGCPTSAAPLPPFWQYASRS